MEELEFQVPLHGADVLAVFSSSGLFLVIPYINPRGWRSSSKELLKGPNLWLKKPEIVSLQRSRGSCLLEMACHTKINSSRTRLLEKSDGGIKQSLYLDTGWLQKQYKNGKIVRSKLQSPPCPHPRIIQNMEVCSPGWVIRHTHHQKPHPTLLDSHSCHNGTDFHIAIIS